MQKTVMLPTSTCILLHCPTLSRCLQFHGANRNHHLSSAQLPCLSSCPLRSTPLHTHTRNHRQSGGKAPPPYQPPALPSPTNVGIGAGAVISCHVCHRYESRGRRPRPTQDPRNSRPHKVERLKPAQCAHLSIVRIATSGRVASGNKIPSPSSPRPAQPSSHRARLLPAQCESINAATRGR